MENRGTPDGSEALASDFDWRAEEWSPEPTSARLFFFATAKLNTCPGIRHCPNSVLPILFPHLRMASSRILAISSPRRNLHFGKGSIPFRSVLPTRPRQAVFNLPAYTTFGYISAVR
jgi:hypothetical protein